MNDEFEMETDKMEYEEFPDDVYEDMRVPDCGSMEGTGCSAVGFQDVNVCIPVTIKPFGEVGNAKTQCLGKAVVSQGCPKCPGKPGEVCKFTISQKLRVEVPVVFGARAEIGEASVDCGCADSCNSCK